MQNRSFQLTHSQKFWKTNKKTETIFPLLFQLTSKLVKTWVSKNRWGEMMARLSTWLTPLWVSRKFQWWQGKWLPHPKYLISEQQLWWQAPNLIMPVMLSWFMLLSHCQPFFKAPNFLYKIVSCLKYIGWFVSPILSPDQYCLQNCKWL